jgi:hypothetical protein
MGRDWVLKRSIPASYVGLFPGERIAREIPESRPVRPKKFAIKTPRCGLRRVKICYFDTDKTSKIAQNFAILVPHLTIKCHRSCQILPTFLIAGCRGMPRRSAQRVRRVTQLAPINLRGCQQNSLSHPACIRCQLTAIAAATKISVAPVSPAVFLIISDEKLG